MLNKSHIYFSISLIFIAFFVKNVLYYLFPYTGLARIGTLSLSILITIIISLVFYYIVKKVKSKTIYISIFSLVSISIIFINFSIYVQEYRPNISNQVYHYIYNIRYYNSVELEDIYIPKNYPDFKHKEGLLEKYITALYKYQDSIPVDGSYSIYMANDINNDKNKIIYSKNDIKNKLDTGAEKVHWCLLELIH